MLYLKHHRKTHPFTFSFENRSNTPTKGTPSFVAGNTHAECEGGLTGVNNLLFTPTIPTAHMTPSKCEHPQHHVIQYSLLTERC